MISLMWTHSVLVIGWRLRAQIPQTAAVPRIALLLLRRACGRNSGVRCNLYAVVAAMVLASKMDMGKEHVMLEEVMDCTSEKPTPENLACVRRAEIELLQHLGYDLLFACRHPLAIEHNKHPDVGRVYTFFREFIFCLLPKDPLEPGPVGEALAYVETQFSCFFVRALTGTPCQAPPTMRPAGSRGQELARMLMERPVPPVLREIYATEMFNNVMLLVDVFRRRHAKPLLETPRDLLPEREHHTELPPTSVSDAAAPDFTVKLVPYVESSST